MVVGCCMLKCARDQKGHNCIHLWTCTALIISLSLSDSFSSVAGSSTTNIMSTKKKKRGNKSKKKSELPAAVALGFGNQASTVVGSLDDYQQQIRLAVHNKAEVVYYLVAGNYFDWLQAEDRDKIDGEYGNIRSQMRHGAVTLVKAGDDIFVDSGCVFLGRERSVPFEGVRLFTMEVKFQNLQCPAHMLLRKMGDMSDLEVIPYYFRDKDQRDRAVESVNSSANV